MTKKTWHQSDVKKLIELKEKGLTWVEISSKFAGSTPNACRKAYDNNVRHKEVASPVKILVLDIETTPLVSYTWGIWDQNVGLNQIVHDWSVLSFAAKWLDSDKIYYADTRNEKNKRNDKKLLKQIWKLIDEADFICGQNSKSFDVKKLNARFILNGMKPPSSFRHIDTMRISKKHFAMTSNKLEYLSKKLNTKHSKLSHHEFSGFELWKECLAGNKKAFIELEKYNIEDILSTEELYKKLVPWETSINFNSFHNDEKSICTCGNENFKKNGTVHTNLGRYQRFVCTSCGKEHVDRTNLLTKEKKKSILK